MPPNAPSWFLFRGPCAERYWCVTARDPDFVKPPVPQCLLAVTGVTLVVLGQKPASCE